MKRRYELFTGMDATGVEGLLGGYEEAANWRVLTMGYTEDVKLPGRAGAGFWVLMECELP